MIRVHVTDPSVLQAIDPADLNIYLESRGWSLIESRGNTVWEYGDDGDQVSILVPQSNFVRGYAGFMQDALGTLSDVEKRMELEILTEIRSSNRDIHYVHTEPATESGTTTLTDGALAIDSIKQWVLAAAVNVTSRNSGPVQPRRKPQQATDFIRSVRLGATYPGSYVLSVQIPLMTAETSELGLEHPELARRSEPLGRRVSRSLASSTAAAFYAAEQALHSRDLSGFEAGVTQGITADLCESLVGFAGEDGHPFSIRFAWATSNPLRSSAPNFSFAPRHIEPLRNAALMFRNIAVETNVRLVGNVVRLHRESQLGAGEVSVLGFLEDDTAQKVQRAWMELGESDYRIATSAHDQGNLISVSGDLSRRGSRYEMLRPHDFQMLYTDDSSPF